MKLKFQRATRGVFPSLIVVSAMIQTSQAGQINPDTAGNVLVPGNYNGGIPAADTINASGGTTPPFRLEIQSGANLTGDAVLLHGIIVSAPTYSIFNDGIVNATNGRGISATQAFTLENTGVIQGLEGVNSTVGSVMLTNSGTITGTGGVAVIFGNNVGVGNNLLALDQGRVVGDIQATGSGNRITSADEDDIEGNISGVQNIDVLFGGDLRISGDVTGPTAATIAGNGSLSGEGTWQMDINVAADGLIYAGDNGFSGVVETNGNVTHQVGSFLGFGVDPLLQITNDGVNATLLSSIGGTYDATNAIVVIQTSSGEAMRNGEYVLVEDDGGLVFGGGNAIIYAGNPDSVLGDNFSQTFVNISGDLVLDVEHAFALLPGVGGSAAVLAGALDDFMADESVLPDNTSMNFELRDYVGLLDGANLAGVLAALNAAVAPVDGALAISSSVINTNYRLHRQTQDRMASARGAAGADSDGTTKVYTGTTSSEVGQTAPPMVAASNRGNLWGAFSYDHQNLDYEGFDSDGETGAFTAGFDYRVAPNLLLGILLDGSKGDLEDGPDIRSFRAAVYGSWGAPTGIYSDFLVGYGDHDLELTDAESLQALLTVGYAMGGGQVKHGPFLGLEYQDMEVDGFSTPLVSVDDFGIDSLRALIGYRVNANMGRFQPYASVAYAHEFRDGDNHVDAAILGQGFRITGGDQGSAVLLTAGTRIDLSQSLALDVGYRGEITTESSGVDSHGGSVGLNWSF